MNRLRAWLPFIALIIAAAYIVSHSMKRDDQRSATAADSGERVPAYIANQAVWVRYGSDGNPLVRVHAERIDYYDDRSATLTTVVMDRLGGTKGHWHLEAPTGTVPAGEQRMLLQPEVAIRGEPRADLPTTIDGRDVWVDWDKRTISSDQPVRGNAPNRAIAASSWQTDFDAAQLQMKGNVEVHYDAPRR